MYCLNTSGDFRHTYFLGYKEQSRTITASNYTLPILRKESLLVCSMFTLRTLIIELSELATRNGFRFPEWAQIVAIFDDGATRGTYPKGREGSASLQFS